MILVAAADTLDQTKAGAGYVCSGRDDQEVIQEAIDSLIEES